jgi:hypothetical protein
VKIKKRDYRRMQAELKAAQAIINSRFRLISEHGPLVDTTLEQLYLLAKYGGTEHASDWIAGPVQFELTPADGYASGYDFYMLAKYSQGDPLKSRRQDS